MTTYRISVRGTAWETYLVDASDEDEARRRMADGDVPEPVISEVEDVEILTVEEETA